MAQRYADYLDREAHHAATPVKAEAIRQAANKLRELERENAALAARLAELERQEPVAWDCGGEYLTKSRHQAQWHEKTHGCATPLYSRPVPSMPAPVCDCGDTITDSNAGCCIDCMNQIRADAERWRMVMIVNTEVMIPPEIRAHHAEICAYLAAMKNGKNIQAAIDAAIACQHDKNTPASAGKGEQ